MPGEGPIHFCIWYRRYRPKQERAQMEPSIVHSHFLAQYLIARYSECPGWIKVSCDTGLSGPDLSVLWNVQARPPASYCFVINVPGEMQHLKAHRIDG